MKTSTVSGLTQSILGPTPKAPFQPAASKTLQAGSVDGHVVSNSSFGDAADLQSGRRACYGPGKGCNTVRVCQLDSAKLRRVAL